MYLPLGKSCNKLLGGKCVTLNSLPILRKSSTQQIDIRSIIKNYTNPNIANQNKITQTQEFSVSFENLIITNTQVSLLHNINLKKIKQNYKCAIGKII